MPGALFARNALKFLVTVFFALSAITGCATVTGHGGMPAEARIIPGVPVLPEPGHQCGPSALATVLAYWYEKGGKQGAVTLEEVSSEVYSSGARGTLGMDLKRYARERGFRARQFQGSIGDLRANVLRGVPSLILVDYGWFGYRAGHFMVVTGYAEGGVIVHTAGKREFVPSRKLERIWSRNGYWTLVVQP